MATGTMSSRNSWWMLAIRGIIALLFGLAVFLQLKMFSFPFLFGLYALIDGIVAAGMGLDDRAGNNRWYIVFLEGLVGIVFGLLAMFFSSVSLLYVIGFWALIMGILELASVFTMQRSFTHDWTMVIGGIASVVLGIVFFLSSGKEQSFVAVFAIVFGVMMFARFVQVKSAMDTAPTATA